MSGNPVESPYAANLFGNLLTQALRQPVGAPMHSSTQTWSAHAAAAVHTDGQSRAPERREQTGGHSIEHVVGAAWC